EANARESLKTRMETAEKKQTLLEELQKRLRLNRIPKTIEAFDISNISGKLAVGAMVVFEDGKPNKDKYRLYKINTLYEPDDYGMMNEVLSRRYKKTADAANLPALILVDGGKGQLNIARNVMNELGINDVDIAAIAKERNEGDSEKVYLPNTKEPVMLRQGSAPDLFVRKIRDEVHRFAITYHKKLREKIKSLLDEIPGIGKAKRNILLKHFGSLENIRQATVEEIAKTPGIHLGLAETIKSALQQNNG
ncbi:MAG: excinuclease ABC subunit C, partial [Deltaproteobacteria bacterium]|nr:excinuclease ABC subunit C [Deltaproteobacteria bacterium]